jgi:bacteriocin biosynthesis cyclodehydratase domain-containing protein
MFTKPKIPSHYYVWCEPPDSSGEESLHFVSHRRAIKLKGRAFAEFERLVIPLLDGRHTLEEIGSKVHDVFALSDLETAFELLADQNVLQEGDAESPSVDELPQFAPQLNFFHELGCNPAEAQQRLNNASVTIFGMGGAGPALAESLANSGIGCIRCVDALPVAPTDLYLSSGFSTSDLGSPRAIAIQRHFAPRFPQSRFETVTTDLSSDEGVSSAAERSDYIASCLDAGQSSLVYKLNRVCLQTGNRWSSCALEGSEIIIGPTVYPRFTPCYLCYKMRVVACAGNPEDAFAFEKLLDQRKHDDSSRCENLAIGASLAANFLALEIVRDLIGLSPVITAGKVIIFNLLDLSSTKHVVLRKPWCPACFPLGTTDVHRSAATGATGRP